MNTLSDQEKRDGWQLLFDGKSTKGWHSFNEPNVGAAWKVQDDALYLDASGKEGRGDIVSDQAFENFHLKFDWKIAPKGNSGLMFLVQEGKERQATWHTGPEYQIIDDVNYPDKLQPVQLSASLYDIIPCPTGYINPVGEWNTGEIILNKGKLEFFVNGKKSVSTTLWDENWKTMIAATKFIKEKDFAGFQHGKIALQDHGAQVWFRNIKIKKL
jgi:Domain of Unknown Function (DUF1080)